MIAASHRQTLLDIARTVIIETITGRPPRRPAADNHVPHTGAAFVTLHVEGELRGCIGHLDDDTPLVRTVAHCARAACTEDPRFPTLSPAELDRLDIEISVLGTFERVTAITDIQVGRHGLLIEREGRRGLLLPQVAADHCWTAERFIAQTCHKAGLSPDSWDRGAVLWRFEAEIFGTK